MYLISGNGSVELPPLKAQFVLIQLDKLSLELKIRSNLIHGRTAAVALECGHDGKRQDFDENHSNDVTVERNVHESDCADVVTPTGVTVGGAQQGEVTWSTHNWSVLATDRNVVL